MERTPPHDTTAEQAVLGAMMLSSAAIGDVVEVLRSSADFYHPAHAVIYDAIVDRYARNLPTDPITLADELRERGDLARVGGAPYLHACVNSVPVAANGEYYAEIVRDCAILWRLLQATDRTRQAVYAAKGDPAGLVDEAQAAIAAVLADDQSRAGTLVGDDIEDYLGRLEDLQNNGRSLGVPTGFTDLDALTGGFHPGQVIVIAARPAMGKSVLAVDLLRSCSITHNLPAVLFSLEMDRDEIRHRLFSAQAQIALHRMRHQGLMNDEDWTKFARNMERVTAAPLHIDDTPNQTLARIQARCRALQQAGGLRLVVIDYLQLMHSGGSRRENRQQEVADMSRSLKLLAKELHVPVVVLSQLNRGPEQRADKKPMMSDLRESGAIEQDADIVILLHREDAYEKESPRAGEADFIVAKHRNGPTATITVAFQGHYSRFVDMAQA
ncbi:replicative DNA helicase [Streptomyces sp.]|uniref:replicative DNA helicase n=1 Tax=Streptomyces sp. TaxID=1931 RepID=UPI002F430147